MTYVMNKVYDSVDWVSFDLPNSPSVFDFRYKVHKELDKTESKFTNLNFENTLFVCRQ